MALVRGLCVVLGALLALLPLARSGAEPRDKPEGGRTAPQNPRSRAESHYAAGVEAFAAKRYREAADQFEKADTIAPNSAYAYNVGLALERLGDNGGALQAYREYLKRKRGAANAVDVLERIERLETALAEQGLRLLSITSTPAGAALSIDGAAVGVTPWVSELSAGRHRIRISLSGYSPVLRDIDLSSTRTSNLDFRLARTREPTHRPQKRPAPNAQAEPNNGHF
jgi:tetratricopeptide (TPR) repeat protein